MIAASIQRLAVSSLVRKFGNGGSKGMRKVPPTYLPVSEHTTNTDKNWNYNLEEHPNFSKKQQEARAQREVLKAIEAMEIVPRRKRRIYNKPLYDYDIKE